MKLAVVHTQFLLLAVTAQCLATAAAAENRVALVIGNSAYRHAAELKNPKNDAADMSAALEKLGFKVVTGLDLDKQGMDRAIRDFATALRGSDVGVLFYAGHGLQVGGSNYLVPIDAQLASTAALDFETVRLDLVQRTMERETATNVLFLDACRDNPLARNLARAMGTRSADIGRGLAPAESGVGTLISFSTQPGNVALDGTGRNSPYVEALLKHLATSGEDLSAVLIGVRNEVMATTHNRQVPWEHSALRARFYFASRQSPPGPGQTPSAQAPVNEKTRMQTDAVAEVTSPAKIAISSKTTSVNQNRPTPIAVGEMVRGRLGERKNYHYWKVDAQPGKYRVVIDVKRVDDAHSNIQSSVVAFSADGREVGQVVRMNEIEFRARAASEIDTSASPDFVLRVGNDSSIVDYWLALFPAGAKVVSPYFVRTPRIETLELGKSVSVVLEPQPGTAAEAWYSASLQGIDYRISADFRRSDGEKSNVQGSVDMFGPMGERLPGTKRVCHVNAIDISARCSTKLSLAEDVQVLFRLSPANAANYNVTFVVEPLN
jgi:Caspase domain